MIRKLIISGGIGIMSAFSMLPATALAWGPPPPQYNYYQYYQTPYGGPPPPAYNPVSTPQIIQNRIVVNPRISVYGAFNNVYLRVNVVNRFR